MKRTDRRVKFMAMLEVDPSSTRKQSRQVRLEREARQRRERERLEQVRWK